ncbi:MAG TPA: hypothetical protein VJZ27_12660, partial [Aggregatilineales bacterium]|nr:hypothetical protein [Aggregatilineales bacterium]
MINRSITKWICTVARMCRRVPLPVILCIFLLFSISIASAQNPTPDIAWTVNGELWLAGENLEARQIVTENACCAVFSPDGTRLAYLLN